MYTCGEDAVAGDIEGDESGIEAVDKELICTDVRAERVALVTVDVGGHVVDGRACAFQRIVLHVQIVEGVACVVGVDRP